jgi:hypothetical protein
MCILLVTKAETDTYSYYDSRVSSTVYFNITINRGLGYDTMVLLANGICSSSVRAEILVLPAQDPPNVKYNQSTFASVIIEGREPIVWRTHNE